jgi:hypothetical protein
MLADGILFNSIEFWTGNNPMATVDAGAPVTKRIASGDQAAEMTFVSTPGKEEMIIEQFQGDESKGTVRMSRMDGLTVATNESGEILFTAESRADGSVVVHDSSGKQVKSYSADKLAQLKKSVR